MKSQRDMGLKYKVTCNGGRLKDFKEKEEQTEERDEQEKR